MDGAQVEGAVTEYLQPLLENKIDTLLLGCTHYPPFLRPPLIDKVAGGNVRIVDPAPFIARKAEGSGPPNLPAWVPIKAASFGSVPGRGTFRGLPGACCGRKFRR